MFKKILESIYKTEWVNRNATFQRSELVVVEQEQQEEEIPEKKYQGVLEPLIKGSRNKNSKSKKLSSIKLTPVKVESKVIEIPVSVKGANEISFEHMKNTELKEAIRKIDPKVSFSKITNKAGLIALLTELSRK